MWWLEFGLSAHKLELDCFHFVDPISQLSTQKYSEILSFQSSRTGFPLHCQEITLISKYLNSMMTAMLVILIIGYYKLCIVLLLYLFLRPVPLPQPPPTKVCKDGKAERLSCCRLGPLLPPGMSGNQSASSATCSCNPG